ncbi:barstar family protein [Rhodococcus sp. C26F]
MVGEAVSGPGGYFSRNLDAFADCLTDGYGTPAAGKFRFIWQHSCESRSALGYAETVRQLTPDANRRTRLETGDVIIRISDNDTSLHPPAVVDTGPHRIPHTRHAVAYRLRTRTDLDPLSLADAARALAEHGHPHPRLHHDHRVISPHPAQCTAAAVEAMTSPWNR